MSTRARSTLLYTDWDIAGSHEFTQTTSTAKAGESKAAPKHRCRTRPTQDGDAYRPRRRRLLRQLSRSWNTRTVYFEVYHQRWYYRLNPLCRAATSLQSDKPLSVTSVTIPSLDRTEFFIEASSVIDAATQHHHPAPNLAVYQRDHHAISLPPSESDGHQNNGAPQDGAITRHIYQSHWTNYSNTCRCACHSGAAQQRRGSRIPHLPAT